MLLSLNNITPNNDGNPLMLVNREQELLRNSPGDLKIPAFYPVLQHSTQLGSSSDSPNDICREEAFTLSCLIRGHVAHWKFTPGC